MPRKPTKPSEQLWVLSLTACRPCNELHWHLSAAFVSTRSQYYVIKSTALQPLHSYGGELPSRGATSVTPVSHMKISEYSRCSSMSWKYLFTYHPRASTAAPKRNSTNISAVIVCVCSPAALLCLLAGTDATCGLVLSAAPCSLITALPAISAAPLAA
jgi:hypothetical protein